MKNLQIKGDYKNPNLLFNYEKGLLEIFGRSWPEHSSNTYDPAFKWIEEYAKNPQSNTTVKVQLEYFNTSSSKMLLELFKRLETIHNKGTLVNVEWYYELDDLDLKEEGENFAEMVNLPIKHVGVEKFDFSF
jgi:hypothetical protein